MKKHEIVEKDGRYWVRRVVLGFIHFYWCGGGDAGWTPIPFMWGDPATKEWAEAFVESCKEDAFNDRKYRRSKSQVIQTTRIP